METSGKPQILSVCSWKCLQDVLTDRTGCKRKRSFKMDPRLRAWAATWHHFREKLQEEWPWVEPGFGRTDVKCGTLSGGTHGDGGQRGPVSSPGQCPGDPLRSISGAVGCTPPGPALTTCSEGRSSGQTVQMCRREPAGGKDDGGCAARCGEGWRRHGLLKQRAFRDLIKAGTF